MNVVRMLRSRSFLLALLLVLGIAAPSRSAEPQASAKSRGPEVIVRAAGRTHYFENRHPHCLAYTLPGTWDFAIQPAALRAMNALGFVGVALHAVDTIPGPAEGDGVSRAVAHIIASTAKDWGRAVESNTAPFPASRAGAVLLEFREVTVTEEMAARALTSRRPPTGQAARLPLRVIAPFDGDLVMVVTVLDAGHAREVFATLEVTEDVHCWRHTIQERFPTLRVSH
jgi:hypothetical protein